MPTLQAVHRPQSISEAMALLERPGVRSTFIAGGTSLVGDLPGEFGELIDLQAVGLDGISRQGRNMVFGSMVRLQTIVDAADEVPDLMRQMAYHEGPNTLRNAATLGGLVAGASAESELLAALLVLDAVVGVELPGVGASYPLPDFLAHRSTLAPTFLLTSVTVTDVATSGHARVARTPRDRPIVAAVAARTHDGATRLALCGVADVPVLLDPDALDDLNPPGDFRGSAAYRKEMAAVVSRRALAQLDP